MQPVYSFHKPALCLALLSSFCQFANAQILTRTVSPNEISSLGAKASPVSDKIATLELPRFDLKSELLQDSVERLRGLPPRFGKTLDVDIDVMAQGTSYEEGDSLYTQYQIRSEGAKSINLIFNRFRLAKGTSLRIFNAKRTVLYGPVTAESNPQNGIFWTDLIPGEAIIIQVSTPRVENGRTDLHISQAVHGYSNAFVGFGDSADCNRDVACPEGNNWQNQANSVAMVLIGEARHCSGALVNNACQNFTPNFLTAFHCLDLDLQNGSAGVLSADERNAIGNWLFRFRY